MASSTVPESGALPQTPTTPTPAGPESSTSPRSPTSPISPTAAQFARRRASTTASVASAASSRLRRASIKLMEVDAPLGMWAATGSTASKAPSLVEIRRGHFGHEGWNHEKQVEHHERRRASTASSGERRLSRTGSGLSITTLGRRKRDGTTSSGGDPFPCLPEESSGLQQVNTSPQDIVDKQANITTAFEKPITNAEPSSKSAAPAGNGYTPPPKLPWATSTKIGLLAFWKWFLTPLGFGITIYGLNVVAWGGMLFLLLCNAAPAMCHPTCNDINSPRRIWIEIDSQILNALFCVTGLGLIPWRFRDLYWLLVFRLGIRGRSKEQRLIGIRRLAGIHRGWFRLQGSNNWDNEDGALNDEANPGLPFPLSKKLDPPLTGVRAPPTALWKMDFVIWCNVFNTFFQICLCGFMWGLNRYNRPSWSTGFFVAIASIVAGLGGIMMFVEGKNVKRVEGVPPKVVDNVKDAEASVAGDNPKVKRDVKHGRGGNVITQEVR